MEISSSSTSDTAGIPAARGILHVPVSNHENKPHRHGSVAAPDVYRLTVAQYERMAETGILGAANLELLDGVLITKMTKKPRHVIVTERLRRLLDQSLPPGWYAREEKPLRISDFSEPEPDIAIVRGNVEDYGDHHPSPQETAIVMEVAESSLARDRTDKLASYALAGIPSYWLIDLVMGQVEVYSEPSGPAVPIGYRRLKTFGAGEEATLVVEGAETGRIAVSELLA